MIVGGQNTILQKNFAKELENKADLIDGKVPSDQLPSYVDDVIEVANFGSLPITGETGKIYITIDTNKNYRWSGSSYFEIIGGNPFNQSLNKEDDVEFDTVNSTSYSVDTNNSLNPLLGEFGYNQDEKGYVFGLGNGVVGNLFEETFYTIKGDELTGIGNGKVVMFSGTDGNLKGKLAVSDGTFEPKYLMGISTQSISHGEFGKVTKFGKVRGISTDGSEYGETWNEGDILYPNPSVVGGLTNVKPTAPSWKNPIGVIISVHATNGTIQVRTEFLPNIGDLSNVNLTNEAEGDILVKKGENYVNNPVFSDTKSYTGFINNENIIVEYDSGLRVIKLTVTDGYIEYYFRGQKKRLNQLAGVTWISPSHDNVNGQYFLQSVDGETFEWSTTPFSFENVLVAYVNYQGVSSNFTMGIREVHGTMDYESHMIDHLNIGTFRKSGFGLTPGTYSLDTDTNASITPGFESGYVQDEDLKTLINSTSEGSYNRIYVGPSNSLVFSENNAYPFHYGTYIQYNNTTSGTRVEGQTGKFYNVYSIKIPVTSDTQSQKYRNLIVEPQVEYNTLEAAQAEDFRAIKLGELANIATELIAYERLTYRTSASYTTIGKVQLASITFVTGSRASQVSVSGLPSDVVTLSGNQTITGAKTFSIGSKLGSGTQNPALKVGYFSGQMPFSSNTQVQILFSNLTPLPTVIIGCIVYVNSGGYYIPLQPISSSDNGTPYFGTFYYSGGSVYVKTGNNSTSLYGNLVFGVVFYI